MSNKLGKKSVNRFIQSILVISSILFSSVNLAAQGHENYNSRIDSLIRKSFYVYIQNRNAVFSILEEYEDIPHLHLEYGLAHSTQTRRLLGNAVSKTSGMINDEAGYLQLERYLDCSYMIDLIMNSAEFQYDFRQYMQKVINHAVKNFNKYDYSVVKLKDVKILDLKYQEDFYAYWDKEGKHLFENKFMDIIREAIKVMYVHNAEQSVFAPFKKMLPNYLCILLMPYDAGDFLEFWNTSDKKVEQLCMIQKELYTYLDGVIKSPRNSIANLMEVANRVTDFELVQYAANLRGKRFSVIEKDFRTATMPLKKGTYTGEVLNTLPHGKGVFTDKKGNQDIGEWKEGKRHGSFIQIKTNGDTIKTLWAEDKRIKEKIKTKNGNRGTFYKDKLFGEGYKYSNGEVYQGMFIDGVLHGQGSVKDYDLELNGTFENGRFVDGVIKSEKSHAAVLAKGKFNSELTGVGSITRTSKNEELILTGFFRHGLLDGTGTKMVVKNIVDTIIYKGDFAYGNPKGQIELKQSANKQRPAIEYTGLICDTVFLKGTIHSVSCKNNKIYDYTGDMFNDEYQGKGVLLMVEKDDTIVYEGGFEKGVFGGYGVYRSKDFMHTGGFKNGKIHGKGISVNEHGEIYDGEWNNGVPHGKAKITFKNGNVWEGFYETTRTIYSSTKRTSRSIGKGVGIMRNKAGRIISRNSSVQYKYHYRMFSSE